MVMGLYQSIEVVGDLSDSGGAEVSYGFIGVGLGLAVGVGKLWGLMD